MPKIIDDVQIYRDVMQAIIQHGYAGATTKLLAKSAGIGEVTLFRKYGSKAQLVQQAMVELAETDDLEENVRFTGDVHHDLLQVVEAYQRSAEKNGLMFFTIIVEAARHPELKEAFDLLQSRLSIVGQLLARYQAEGILKPEHPLHALANLIGPIMAINMLNVAVQGISVPQIDFVEYVSTFVRGHQNL